MKVVIVLAALIAVSNAAATLCPMTVCDSSLSNMCYSVTSTTDTYEIKIKKCESTQYCNASNFSNPANGATATCATYTAPTITGMYPGYDCTQNDECASNNCGSNGCTGLAKDATCVSYAASTTNADKMCGAGLYCKDAKCAEGVATDATCTSSAMCTGRNSCIGGKCIALASVDTDGACVSDYYCKADMYCPAGKCVAAVAYSTGTYGALCTASTECGGSCLCGYANPDGKGNCGPMTTGGAGKAAINSTRSSVAGSSYSCPLGTYKLTNGGCAGTYTTASFAKQNTQSCYKDFRIAGGSMLPQPGSSAFGLYASVLGFVAYLLA